jgi:hypothetical protein
VRVAGKRARNNPTGERWRAGVVVSFARAMVGASSHVIQLDAGGEVKVQLARKGNGKTAWEIHEPPTTVCTGDPALPAAFPRLTAHSLVLVSNRVVYGGIRCMG